jgi:hypothetical protein
MSGVIPPLPNAPSWRGAHLKAQGQLYIHSVTLPLSLIGRF